MLVLVLVLSLSSELLVGRARASVMMVAALLRMLLLSLSSLSSRAPPWLLRLFPPASYTNLPLSLVLKLLARVAVVTAAELEVAGVIAVVAR